MENNVQYFTVQEPTKFKDFILDSLYLTISKNQYIEINDCIINYLIINTHNYSCTIDISPSTIIGSRIFSANNKSIRYYCIDGNDDEDYMRIEIVPNFF